MSFSYAISDTGPPFAADVEEAARRERSRAEEEAGECRGCLFSGPRWAELSYLRYRQRAARLSWEGMLSSELRIKPAPAVPRAALPGSERRLSASRTLLLCAPVNGTLAFPSCGLPRCQLEKPLVPFVVFSVCPSWKPVRLTSFSHLLI